MRPPQPKLIVDLACGKIVCEQWVPQEIAKVFAFFSEARNLELLTPPFLHFRIMRMSSPRIGEGTEIQYRLSLHGMPLRWKSRILGWRPCRSFSDLQVSGPYRYWHHRHDLEPYGGGTWVRDRVDFKLPLHALTSRFLGGPLKNDLEEIFRYRQNAISDLLKGDL